MANHCTRPPEATIFHQLAWTLVTERWGDYRQSVTGHRRVALHSVINVTPEFSVTPRVKHMHGSQGLRNWWEHVPTPQYLIWTDSSPNK